MYFVREAFRTSVLGWFLCLCFGALFAIEKQSALVTTFSELQPEWMMAVDGGVDPTRYNHDSSLICYRGEWLLGWNGNLDPREGAEGQKNYFVRSSNWNGFSGKSHVAEFQSASYSSNPVPTGEIEWHPTLMEFRGRLECWWFATPGRDFARSVGYKSVWDDKTRKWTNYKIQLLQHGRIAFSSKVEKAEESDRIVIGGTSYVPMPLATVVEGKDGKLVMPMILSPSPSGGQLGGANEVVVFSSDDHGDTWRWSPIVPKGPEAVRGSIWEPWMTWDGETYHLFCRNFTEIPPGTGFSYTKTKNLGKWPAFTEAALDVMPMRGETVTDGSNWYVAFCTRAQIGTGFNSSKRRGMALFRSRNGKDWSPIADLLPPQLNAFYCWLSPPKDGFLYYSCTVPPGIAVGRMPLPARNTFSVYPNRSFLVSANKTPYSDGKELWFLGSDYLRIPVTLENGTSFSIAANVRTGDAIHGFALDFTTSNPALWGNGLLPMINSGWRPRFSDWMPDNKTAGFTARTAEITFVGISFDESTKAMQVVRRNQQDLWETKTWHVHTLYLDRIPPEGTTTVVDGKDYRWRTHPVEDRDVAIAPKAVENLQNLSAAVLKNDQNVRGAPVSQMFSTGVRGVRSHVMFFLDSESGKTATDGKYLRNDGNTFDTPKGSITFNGNNRSPDPWVSPYFEAGMELWRFGLWDRALSEADFKALYNSVVPIHGFSLEDTLSKTDWESAKILLDPNKKELSDFGVDQPGHLATKTDDGVLIPGDAAVAIEVPGSGDWEWEAEFAFDEFPIGMSWDLLAVGDKFSLGRLEVSHDSESVYTLKRGDSVFCQVRPNVWTPLKIRYKAGTAELIFPIEHVLRVSARPLLGLGRTFYNRIEPPEVNRSSKYRTLWRNFRLTAYSDTR
jgi:hypothetical protein